MTDSYDRVMGLVEQYDDEDESPLYSQNVSWDSVIYANFLEHWEAMVTTPEREDVVTNFIQSVVDC